MDPSARMGSAAGCRGRTQVEAEAKKRRLLAPPAEQPPPPPPPPTAAAANAREADRAPAAAAAAPLSARAARPRAARRRRAPPRGRSHRRRHRRARRCEAGTSTTAEIPTGEKFKAHSTPSRGRSTSASPTSRRATAPPPPPTTPSTSWAALLHQQRAPPPSRPSSSLPSSRPPNARGRRRFYAGRARAMQGVELGQRDAVAALPASRDSTRRPTSTPRLVHQPSSSARASRCTRPTRSAQERTRWRRTPGDEEPQQGTLAAARARLSRLWEIEGAWSTAPPASARMRGQIVARFQVRVRAARDDLLLEGRRGRAARSRIDSITLLCWRSACSSGAPPPRRDLPTTAFRGAREVALLRPPRFATPPRRTERDLRLGELGAHAARARRWRVARGGARPCPRARAQSRRGALYRGSASSTTRQSEQLSRRIDCSERVEVPVAVAASHRGAFEEARASTAGCARAENAQSILRKI